jgi:5-methylcytosine-specific restriction endonuclease McrA
MRVKTCTRCGQTKPLCQFPPVRRSEPEKLQSWCRACFAEANRRNYLRNIDRERARLYRQKASRIAESKERAIEYLLEHPCVDCGEKDIIVLQFDHLHDKSFDVSVMISTGTTWTRIAIEIAKCDVRCANCHRRETARRRLRGTVATVGVPKIRLKPVQLRIAAAAVLRTCRVCGEQKPLTEFPFRSIVADTRHWICLACQRAWSQAWYASTVDRPVRAMRARGSARRGQLAAQTFAYLNEHPCVDCGESDPIVLDFDHLRDKVAAVSTLVMLRRPWIEVRSEIDKCEVRCANCHARKTAREIGNYRTKIG